MWRTLFLISLSVCAAVPASAQRLPKLEPEMARELYGVYAACRAYWNVMSQCLPTGISEADAMRVREMMQKMQVIGIEHMKWLAAKGQLSGGMQQQIATTASERVKRAAAGTCQNTPSLMREHREKCAALFENVASAQNEKPEANQPSQAEIVESATKFIVSTCYEPIDDISRVTSYARIKDWKALAPDLTNMFRPVDSRYFEAWEVDYDGFTYIVSVNRGQFKDRPTEVCQVTVQQKPDQIVKAVTSKIKNRLIGTNNSNMQINEMYELIQHPSVKNAVLLVSRSAEHKDLFTIAFMGIK